MCRVLQPLPPERSAAEERECDEELARKWLEDVAAELRPPDDGAADPRVWRPLPLLLAPVSVCWVLGTLLPPRG